MGISQAAVAAEIPAPRDAPFGEPIKLEVDASDVLRRVLRVHETIPVHAGTLVLLYPQWLPGRHRASGAIDRVAGLQISAQGAHLEWTRDTLNPFAYRVTIPAGISALEIEFEFLKSPASPDERTDVTHVLERVEWPTVLLYPAGYYAHDIPVSASLVLPDQWKFASALAVLHQSSTRIQFETVALDMLVDSPILAGRFFNRVDLNPGGDAPVWLDIAADEPDETYVGEDVLVLHRNLVAQTLKLFNSRHYAHYDFLLSVSDSAAGIGLEHHQSSEDGVPADYFSDWGGSWGTHNLLTHEFVHSWNGKFRRPIDLTTPNYNVPMQDSLLWMYEGQTDYWSNVLATRAGLYSPEQFREALAEIAADQQASAGRTWRNLQDTTNQSLLGAARTPIWPSWQRGADYYREMTLVWLDVDTKIRELSGERRSLDDFARLFFAGTEGPEQVKTYSFEDVVAALNQVEPYDWGSTLRAFLDTHDRAPLAGLERSGWRLSFSAEANAAARAHEGFVNGVSFRDSIGFNVARDGLLSGVRWMGPAFEAQIAPGMRLIAVNSRAFKPGVLETAIAAARNNHDPIELLVRDGDFYRTALVNYHEGLRYPHLVRIPGTPDRLTAIGTALP